MQRHINDALLKRGRGYIHVTSRHNATPPPTHVAVDKKPKAPDKVLVYKLVTLPPNRHHVSAADVVVDACKPPLLEFGMHVLPHQILNVAQYVVRPHKPLHGRIGEYELSPFSEKE